MDYYISQNRLYKLQEAYNKYRMNKKIKFLKTRTTFLPNSLFEFNRYTFYLSIWQKNI